MIEQNEKGTKFFVYADTKETKKFFIGTATTLDEAKELLAKFQKEQRWN